jgi:hypothetical protein
MSDDLVKRLRELNTFEWHARPATSKEACFAAADSIEACCAGGRPAAAAPALAAAPGGETRAHISLPRTLRVAPLLPPPLPAVRFQGRPRG